MSLMVSVAVDCDPVPTDAGSWPKLIDSVSWSWSASLNVEIVKVLDVSPEAKLTAVLLAGE